MFASLAVARCRVGIRASATPLRLYLIHFAREGSYAISPLPSAKRSGAQKERKQLNAAAACVVPAARRAPFHPPPSATPYLVHPVAHGGQQRVPLRKKDGPSPVGGAQQVGEAEVHRDPLSLSLSLSLLPPSWSWEGRRKKRSKKSERDFGRKERSLKPCHYSFFERSLPEAPLSCLSPLFAHPLPTTTPRATALRSLSSASAHVVLERELARAP